MFIAIAAHLGIGLGALACQKCGRKFCPHRATLTTGIFLLVEACASVLVIDHFFNV